MKIKAVTVSLDQQALDYATSKPAFRFFEPWYILFNTFTADPVHRAKTDTLSASNLAVPGQFLVTTLSCYFYSI